MILLILFDVYVVLGTICAVMNYKAVFDPDFDDSDFGKMAEQQRLVYRTHSPYIVMAMTTVMWLPSAIVYIIQYVKWKNS